MNVLPLIKNIPFAKAEPLTGLVDYAEGQVVSRTFAQSNALSLTLFAFDAGEEIGTHSAPGDAMVQVLDGEVEIAISGKPLKVSSGEAVIMPANKPHALRALTRMKMLLTMIRT